MPMQRTIQITQPSVLLPDGIDENELFVHLGLPIETPFYYPDLHLYVVNLTASATDLVENMIGYDFRAKSYQTQFENSSPNEILLRPYLDDTSFAVKDKSNSNVDSQRYEVDWTNGVFRMKQQDWESYTIEWKTSNRKVPSGIKSVILAMVGEMYNTKTSVPTINDNVKLYLSSYRLARTLR